MWVSAWLKDTETEVREQGIGGVGGGGGCGIGLEIETPEAFSILSKSKSYRHCTFRKSESRPALSVTCAVACSVSDTGSSEYVLEGSRAFTHNCLKD